MSDNRAVVYAGAGAVEVQTIDFPTFELRDGPGVHPANVGRRCDHGVILKVVSTNICGSDQHMVRGRTTAPAGLVLGHEITGEVIEAGTRRRVHPSRRPVFGSFQHRVREMPDVQGRAHRRVPEHQSRSSGRRTATSTWAAGSAAKPST